MFDSGTQMSNQNHLILLDWKLTITVTLSQKTLVSYPFALFFSFCLFPLFLQFSHSTEFNVSQQSVLFAINFIRFAFHRKGVALSLSRLIVISNGKLEYTNTSHWCCLWFCCCCSSSLQRGKRVRTRNKGERNGIEILSLLDMKRAHTNNVQIDVARFFLCYCVGKVIITEKVQFKHMMIKC